MVQPGREHGEAPQFTPVLVGKDVVRVVRPRAVVTKRPEDLAREVTAGEDPVRAIRLAGCPFQNILDVVENKAPPPAVLVAHRRVRGDRQCLRAERRERVLRDVVAERMEEGGRDHLGPAGHLREATRVELDPVGLPRAVADRETRGHSFTLASGDDPGAFRRPLGCRQYRLSGVCRADAVREPAGVGHIVDGIDVHRTAVDRLARPQEGVLDEVVLIADLHRLRPGCVL